MLVAKKQDLTPTPPTDCAPGVVKTFDKLTQIIIVLTFSY